MRASVRSTMGPITVLLSVMAMSACGSASTPSPSPIATETPAPSVVATVTPSLAPAEPAPTAPSKVYVVRAGDTLIRIAANYGITLKALRAANPQVTEPRTLQIGQRLVIPSP